ncbi:MAG: chemotaxis protein CheD [Proteobacteria bacterium]|nr:chemotaxis protein CheD [Pseudomonadota bacterium]
MKQPRTPSTPSNPEQYSRQDYPVEHLRIGECIFTRRPTMITTVLGSCVSATFHHGPSGAAAICHAMLPTGSDRPGEERSCKYADVAVQEIMVRFGRLGIKAGDLEVKLFGGGFTIEPERKGLMRDIVDVGSKNVEAAREALAGYGLKIASEDVLGRHGRKVFFLTSTGEAWVRRLSAGAEDLAPSPF